MDNSYIEILRSIQEQQYREIDSSAIVTVESSLVDYDNNETIKEYKSKGYKLFDSNRFGEGLEPIGEFLVFVKDKNE